MKRIVCLVVWFWCLAAVRAESVDFDRDILPILSKHCFACHGPDANQRQGDLRLDRPGDRVTELLSSADPASSELLARVRSADPQRKMPPPDSGSALAPREVALLSQWVSEGGAYRGHWAWERPRRPGLPSVNRPEWTRNEIDRFVLAMLEQHEMAPSPAADRVTLIRRVSLDVRGLPPTPAEVRRFVEDPAKDAYEAMVGRMLASKQYGERMAQDWLDLARYGDTNGYHADSDREMWLYRDYVIDAFNANMPFNRFILENLAGDLLPNATVQSQIASGFNRNVTFNEEGGADPDEFYVAYAIDRANTTGQVFLGMTFGCAQCHDHKYDPLSQREYYQFYAFFNSVQGEVGAGGPGGFHNKPLPPLLEVKTPQYLSRVETAKTEHEGVVKQLAAAKRALLADTAGFQSALMDWAADLREGRPAGVTEEGLILWLSADDLDGNRIPDADQPGFAAPSVVGTWHDRSGNGLDAIAHGTPTYSKAAFNGKPAIRLDGEDDFLRTLAGGERLQQNFTMLVVLRHEHLENQQMLLMWGVEQSGKRRGMWKVGTSQFLGFNGHGADVVGSQKLVTERPQIAVITKEGGQHQIRLYLDGQPVGQGKPALNPFELQAPNPVTIGANNGGGELTAAQFAEVMVFDRRLVDRELGALTGYLAGKYNVSAKFEAVPPAILAIARVPHANWDSAQTQQMETFFSEQVYFTADPKVGKLTRREEELGAIVASATKSVPTTMVMLQQEKATPAYVLMRGDFQNPGEQVTPDVPALFPPMAEGQPRNRLGLARWMSDPRHPLVSRVAVNRYWKQLFGVGLVKTLGDLGTQGDRPSHPRLLDWLAVEFIESGWNIKQLQKRMLLSATYRQSARHTGRFETIDPENRFLSRASRFRLSAEEIRDNALAISGLLSEKIGGPSVKPYQPADYYADKIGRGWDQSRGEDLYRRGLYTYWRRTTVYPTFQIFDAPSREFCTVNRPRTNTPLQALVLLNDPTFVEAARVFGQRIMLAGGATLAEKLSYAFEHAVARSPSAAERQALAEIWQQQKSLYKQEKAAAAQLVGQGASVKAENLDTVEHAAWTALASVLLNLDETITRE